MTLELLLSLPTSEFFLWNGHGGCLNVWGNQWPTLVTRQSLQGWQRNLKEDFWGTDVTACTVKIKGSGLYWAITPHFVETYIKMDQGMVYLSTCHSGQSNQLAAAFMNAGAKTVFVNVGNSTVKTWYTQELMKLVLECMSGSYDDIFHTSGEALQLANDIFARSFDEQGGVTVEDKKYPTLEDFVNGLQNGVHTEVIGDELYTLCPCIRGTVSFEDNLSESSISSIIKTLSVELDSAEGEFLKSTTLTGEKFYFNDLEPGTYQITLYSDGKPVGRSISVEVTEHRYTNAELFYELPVLLEGYVYNADGEPLSDVTVSAELTGNPEAYSSETKSDENGYYCIEVFGVNTYTLSYDRSGYSSLQNELNVTSKMYNHAQKGAKNKLEDVILMKGGNCGDNLIWTLDSDGVLKISGVGKMEQHGSGNREWPNTVQSVVIEEGVTSIGAFSFYDLANLTSVTLPDSLERIEKYAFTYCSSLQEIILPENVAFIGEAAFKDCKSLRTIIIPEKISTLEKNVFSGCTSLTDIHLPDGLETISHSFYGCSSLTQIALPESLTSLSSGAFNECTSLTDVYYEGSLQEWETLTKDWSGGLITYYNDRLKNASVHCLG